MVEALTEYYDNQSDEDAIAEAVVAFEFSGLEVEVRNEFPPGWDEVRVQRIIAHYEGQSDDEAAAEDEAFYDG